MIVKIMKDIMRIHIFEGRNIYKDENGDLTVEFCSSKKARDFFFNINRLGYIRYRLREVISLPTVSSKLLFFLFEFNAFRHKWEISLEELKKYLGIENKYSDTKLFMRRILKPAIEYIEKYTDMEVSYEKIVNKYGKIIGFEFSVTSTANYRKDLIKDNDSLVQSSEIKKETVSFVMETLDISEKDALTIILKAEENNISFKELEERIKYVNTKKQIDNVTGYMLSLLDKNKWQNVKTKREDKKSDFNNFQQTNLDDELDELEKLFLKEVNETSK